MLTALGTLIAAIAGLLTVLHNTGIWIGSKPESSPAIDRAEDLPEEPHGKSSLVGEVGWIYVGTKVNGAWGKTSAEGSEPVKTLIIDGALLTGGVYELVGQVRLRAELPKQSVPGARPPMTREVGVIRRPLTVKIDQIVEIELKNPDRTWIWGHVTVGR